MAKLKIKNYEIRAIRDALKENQTVFAERFRIDQTTLSRWETLGVPNNAITRWWVEKILQEMAVSGELLTPPKRSNKKERAA
jgi:transcriptional regulator with XRE-family HTH domain